MWWTSMSWTTLRGVPVRECQHGRTRPGLTPGGGWVCFGEDWLLWGLGSDGKAQALERVYARIGDVGGGGRAQIDSLSADAVVVEGSRGPSVRMPSRALPTNP